MIPTPGCARRKRLKVCAAARKPRTLKIRPRTCAAMHEDAGEMQIIVLLPGMSPRAVQHEHCAVCGRGESYSLRGRDQWFWNFLALRAAQNEWSRAHNKIGRASCRERV